MHLFPFKHDHQLTEYEFINCCKDCERSYRLIKEQLDNFYQQIKGYTREDLRRLTQSEIYQLYLVLDDIAHFECGNHLAEQIIGSPHIQQNLPKIRQYYNTFFDVHESYLVKEILTADDPWQPLLFFGLYPRYEALIRTQMNALDLPIPQRPAFIGCGPMPLSLILMHQLYGVKSIGVDMNPQAVALARQCVEQLNMSEAITIIQGNEESLRDMDWDLVVIAALAEPKEKIFAGLRQIMAVYGKKPVICRTYSGLLTLLHPPIKVDDYKGFRIQHEIRPGTNRVNNTLLQLEMVE